MDIKEKYTFTFYNKGETDGLKTCYTKLPNTLLKALGEGLIDQQEYIIITYLYTLVNSKFENTAFPTLDQIASATTINRKTVSNRIKSLEAKGLIHITKNTTKKKGSVYNNNVYRLFYLLEKDNKKTTVDGSPQ